VESIGILGYGRFGKVLASLLTEQYAVNVYDPKLSGNDHDDLDVDVHFVSEEALLKEKTIFIATPINQFETVIQSIAPRLSPESTILDVCSIKLYPVKIMQKYLKKSIGIISTHPLFGPDSIDSTQSLNFMMYPVRDTQHCYDQWKRFFAKQFTIVEITPDEHDRMAAESQGVVHFVARFLNEAKLHKTPIDTMGFKQLLGLVKNNCNDTWELFHDLQSYNPYSKAMITRLEQAFDAVKSKLYPVGSE